MAAQIPKNSSLVLEFCFKLKSMVVQGAEVDFFLLSVNSGIVKMMSLGTSRKQTQELPSDREKTAKGYSRVREE